MTTPLSFPEINGLRHDWSSIELKANSQLFMGIKSIDYEWTREVALVRGFSPDPLGQTRGTNTFGCSIELYLAEWNLFLSQLGNGFGDAFFSIQISFAENGFDQITDQVLGSRLVGIAAHQEGEVSADQDQVPGLRRPHDAARRAPAGLPLACRVRTRWTPSVPVVA